MNIDNPKLKKLAEENSLVQELIDELKSYREDPQKVFYNEVREMVLELSREMRNHRKSGKAILSNHKDDKIFERIRTILVDAPKIFEGLKKGAGIEEDVPQKEKLKGSNQVAF